MKSLLILGATSDIARATALEFAFDGWNIILAGRDVRILESYANDIVIRTGQEVSFYYFDAYQNDNYTLWDQIPICPDAVLCAIGLLGDMKEARHNQILSEQICCANFVGLVPIISRIADDFEKRKSGIIIGISSVAGDRGRASNYIYGAAKAGFSAFLSGLRQRLYKQGVQVITIKPGYVATKMTQNIELPPFLTSQPKEVAIDILNATKNKKDIVYTKWFWRWIMLIIIHLPNFIFKRINF